MLTAMAHAAVGVVPPHARAAHPGRARRSLSMPLSLLFDPDSFYLGVLPVIAEVAGRARRPADPGRTGRAARPDDDGLSGEPADAGDVPRRRPLRHRARRAPAIHGAVAVRGVGRDDDRCRALRSVSAVKATAPHRVRRRLSGDRIEPAVELAERGELDYLVFECLAERTIALAQQARAKDPDAGYDPLLARAHAGGAARRAGARGVRIITNMGAANPPAAAAAVRDRRASARPARARRSPRHGRRCARRGASGEIHVVAKPASAVLDSAIGSSPPMRTSAPSRSSRRCAGGADVVITGRVADPSLFRRAAGARVRLGRSTTGRVLGARHAGRAPARVRRAGHGRLLRRSRASRMSTASRGSASRSPRCRATARRSSPRWPARAGA